MPAVHEICDRTAPATGDGLGAPALASVPGPRAVAVRLLLGTLVVSHLLKDGK